MMNGQDVRKRSPWTEGILPSTRAVRPRTEPSSHSRRRAAPYLPAVKPLIDPRATHPQFFNLPPPAGDCRGQDARAPKSPQTSAVRPPKDSLLQPYGEVFW